MAESFGEQDWRSQQFRERILQSIEQKLGNVPNANAREIENLAFERSSSKEQYLQALRQYFAMRVRGEAVQRGPTAAFRGVTLSAGVVPGQQRMMTDPLNALQSLARQGTPGAALTLGQPGQQMQVPQPGMISSGPTQDMMNSLSSTGPVGQTLMITGQQIPNQLQGAQPMGQIGTPRQQMQQTFVAQPQLVQSGTTTRLQMRTADQNFMGMQRGQQPIPGNVQPMQQPIPGTVQPMQQPIPGNVQPMQQTLTNPNITNVQTMQQALTGNVQTMQQPQQFQTFNLQPNVQPGTLQRPTMAPVNSAQLPGVTNPIAPSPAPGLIPMSSPPMMSVSSPQGITLSPAGSLRSMAPSPGHPVMAASVPQQATANQASPAGAVMPLNTNNASEEQLYNEKLRQLQKYIEPLRRMIARMEATEDTVNVPKMRNLLEVLSTTKKVPLAALLKCEKVLEKLDLGQGQTIQPQKPAAATTNLLPVKEQQLCQSLVEAVSSLIDTPTFNHSLQRTFGSALHVLHGSNFTRPLSPPNFDLNSHQTPQDIPHLLQQEVALLGQKFSITRDSSWPIGSQDIHLVCSLEQHNLPTVPPLSVCIPASYPDNSPICNSLADSLLEERPFLQNVYRILHRQLVRMPDKFSLSALLDAWELSVRSACQQTSCQTAIMLSVS